MRAGQKTNPIEPFPGARPDDAEARYRGESSRCAMVYRTALRRAGAVSALIIGATKPHHLDDAAAAVDIDLTADEVTALEEHHQVRLTCGF